MSAGSWIKAIIAILALVTFIGGTTIAYFQGRADGYDKRVAQDDAGTVKALEHFGTKWADQNKRMETMMAGEAADRDAARQNFADWVQNNQRNSDAALSRLVASFSGTAAAGCFLTPVQRRLLECIRRPDSGGCTAAAGP